MSKALHDAMTARDEYTQPCYEIAKTMAQETRLTFAEAYDAVQREVLRIRDANKEARA